MKFYGQFNPPLDRVLFEHFLRDKKGGFYIECGASDGLSENTTKFFEESMGWHGINIEPVPYLFNKLRINRPNAINICTALSDSIGKSTFKQAIHPKHGWHFGNGSIKHHSSHLQQLINDGCSFEILEVPITTYSMIIAENHVKHVDLMVLDVEGHELNVINGMSGCNTLPRILCVEHTIAGLDLIKPPLTRLGYGLMVSYNGNGIFCHAA